MLQVKVGENLKPAVEAMQSGNLSAAAEHCSEALQHNPQDLGAIHMLSTIYTRLGRLDDAVVFFNKGLKIAPDEPTMLCGLASIRTLQGLPDEALELYERALQSVPENHIALTGKATLLERLGKFEEARTLLEPIVANGGEDVSMATVYARLLAEEHKAQEAVALLDRHIHRSGNRRTNSLNHQDPRARMLYLKGRLLDEMGEHDRAWEAWMHANEIGRAPFDADAARRNVEVIKHVYSAERLAVMPRANTQSDQLVFIASMPRSGSTLVERIIAAHPDARGIGENTQMLARVNDIAQEITEPMPYPPSVTKLSRESVDRLSSRYLSQVKPLAPSAQRIVDKNLKNFLLVGLIELLLPNARIVHVTRDPMDTCLSCFMAPLSPTTHAYATDISDIAVQKRNFDDLMQHWHAVSSLQMLTVAYEDLVVRQDETTRTIIEFCGLPWNDACLQFHDSDDVSITTESYAQVRKPMYDSASGRWKRYEKYLDSAKAVFADAVPANT